MHWTRVKTILIWVFVVINLILVLNIALMYSNTVNISPQTINDTVAVLKSRGIGINPAIIATRGESMRSYEAISLVSESDKLAATLLGSGYQKLSQGEFKKDEKTLQIKDGRFIYTDKKPSDELFKKENITSSDVLGYLKSKGFDVGHIMSGEPIKNEGNFEIQFTKLVDGKKLFESEIKIVAIPMQGIARLEGAWLNPIDDGAFFGGESVILRQITGILVDLIQNPDLPKNGGVNITAIETGYSVGGGSNNLEHKGMSIIPAYRIYTSDGKHYMYDARTGEYYKND